MAEQIGIKELFASIPSRFRPEKAEGINLLFHFDLGGDEPVQYSVTIKDNQCSVNEGLLGQPNCIIKAKSQTYIDIETGKTNPQMALMLGKVKVSNIGEMMQFAKLFRRFEAKAEAGENVAATLSRKPKQGPLVGIRVLDLTRLLPGPLATMMMADMGAEVIKIEDRDDPDYIRNFPPLVGKESAFYLSLNRSKRSLSLNLRSKKGKELFMDLVRSADVVIEQYRPGVLAKEGLGYEEAKLINEKIVYVSITGYGQTGPYSQKAGHDLNYIAYSGVLGNIGTAERPVIPGVQMADIMGGSYAAVNACLAALLSRNTTGKGQHVDVSMTDAVMPLNSLIYAEFAATGNAIAREGFSLSGSRANYNIYKCKDGKFVALGALEPKFWNGFCDLVQKPEWKDGILDEGGKAEQLKEEVATLFLTKTRDEWVVAATGHDICLAPVLEQEELSANEHLSAREMIIEMETVEGNKLKTIGVPLKFLGTPAKPSWPSPHLGEDNGAILGELGLSPDEIAKLRENRVI